MKVLKRTPRTEMRYEALIRKVLQFFDEMVEGSGEEATTMDLAVTHFARLSSRIEPNGKSKIGLAAPGDDPETIRAKFENFLDADWGEVEEMTRAIRNHDAPADPATAPEPPEESEKN